MEPGRFYNHHSTLQAAAAELGAGWLAEAAATVPLPSAGAITIADYGASQGHNSMTPVAKAVDGLRARTTAPIAVVHTDLPDNDFSAIFDAVDRDEVSYLRGHEDVFPYAIGRSFYARLFPRSSVQLGWSAITTNWLSRLPAALAGHLNAASASAVEREPFAVQAAEDWAEFLWNRAAELAPGGRMVMVEPCAAPDGTMPASGAEVMMDEVVAELVDEGRLTADQARVMTLPVYLRTPEEYLGPIEAGGLVRVHRAEVVEAPVNPIADRFARDGDAGAYARAMADSTRAWAGHMLFGTLPAEQASVEDEFFARYVAKGEADPDRLSQQVFHVVMEFGPEP
jgi:hypothetical protein